MDKKMENEMETLGPFKGVYRENTSIMENQMEKKMEKLNGNWCYIGLVLGIWYFIWLFS